MAECMLDEQAKKKLQTIQLSNNIVRRCIQDLSANVEDKLLLQHDFSHVMHFPCKQTSQQMLQDWWCYLCLFLTASKIKLKKSPFRSELLFIGLF
jgi:hypothetical protein